MLRTKKLIVWSLFAIPVFVLAGNLVLAGKPVPPPPLPNVRYRIKYVELPGGFVPNPEIGGINNDACVVGFYDRADVGGVRHGFLYDSSVNQDLALDLHALLAPSIPPGWTLRSASDISDVQVVVGVLQDGVGNQQGFALDLGTEIPVVDLLPTLGSTLSMAAEVNENGDILVAYKDASGAWASFLFNPGIYNGDPGARALRNGVPMDFSHVDVLDDGLELLPLSGESTGFRLNNPIAGRAQQIAGATPSGLAFRYTVGGSLEVFTAAKLNGGVLALNDDGRTR
ncbi:MAG: hypothetical protein ACYC3X_17595 [Pirellulaceae bacterium]